MAETPAARRSGCPISYALEVFGDRWTLLVLRDIVMHGKRHYRDLLAGEEGIATNILSDRLRRLEARGLISKRPDESDRRQQRYGPTEAAIALLPMLLEMVVWGIRNDPDTAAPPEFVERFEQEREAVIAEYTAAARPRLQET